MTTDTLDDAFDRIWRIADALNLPELVRSTTHGTPSLKVKRKVIDKKYKDVIDSMYADEALMDERASA